MMIFGIGIDVVEVERVESSIAEYGERFVSRVFTERRAVHTVRAQKTAGDPLRSARFAAKEAVLPRL